MKKEINVEIGSMIKKRRLEIGFTREKCAEIIGVAPQFLAAVEQGIKGVSPETLRKISRALSTSSDYILFGSEAARNDLSELESLLADTRPEYIPLIIESMRLQLRQFAEISRIER